MKILLHGDNQVASRQKLKELTKPTKQEVVRLDGAKLDETMLRQALESQSFLGEDKLVVIEGLPARSLISILIDELTTSIILWVNKKITPPKSFQAELFRTPATIFKFLDFLKPPIPEEAPELILYMLCRRVSDLIIAKDKPDLLTLASWQKSKLIAQARIYTLPWLINLHSKLLNLEYEVKTGQNILPLRSSLDLLLATL